MSRRQKQILVELNLDHEWVLDGMEPHEFKNYPYFGPTYVEYVEILRGTHIPKKRNLLNKDDDGEGVTAPAYSRKPDSFHPLDSGNVDVCITVTLSSPQAHWLEGLLRRLPEMFPGDKESQNLGFAIRPWLLETMKQDTTRGGLAAVDGTGTMSKVQMDAFRRGNA
jgi:hypothetical protein